MVARGMVPHALRRSKYLAGGADEMARAAARPSPWWTAAEAGPDASAAVSMLEARWTTIRDEALSSLAWQARPSTRGARGGGGAAWAASGAQFAPQETHAKLVDGTEDGGGWLTLTLFDKGARDDAACAAMPTACAVAGSLPLASFGVVKVSVMMPGTHVWPHCGPTNARLRLHLGLQVPSSEYMIKVRDAPPRAWKEGEVLLFDDSWEHEIWAPASAASARGEARSAPAAVAEADAGALAVVGDALVAPPTPVLPPVEYEVAAATLGKSSYRAARAERPTRGLVARPSAASPSASQLAALGQTSFMPTSFVHARIILIVDLWNPDLNTMERGKLLRLTPGGGRQ